jgi:mannose-6-phosphate isomerase
MELPQHEVDAILLPVVQKELRQRSFHESEKDEAGYWVGQYYLNKKAKYIDRGVFAIYMMNIVHLEPGQGIFQAAGVPHAYLQGQNVELMANSDNVLRGGLTNKHIDVPELMKHTKFEAVTPRILKGDRKGCETHFKVDIDDFAISKIIVEKDRPFTTNSVSAEIIICVEGSGTISAANKLEITKGDAVIVFAGNDYTLTTNDQATFFRAMAG